jgi:glycosyltransferase involved in cell wall biosynthesis
MKIRFWSSTEYSGFLAGLMRELSDAGFDAQQCFQISEASYRSAKSAPARLWLRLRQYVVYPAQLCGVLLTERIANGLWRIANKRKNRGELGELLPSGSRRTSPLPNTDQSLPAKLTDVCVVSTNTFYAPLLATYLHPNVVHLVYDLFPEAMIHSGKWREGTLKVRLVRWLTWQTLKRAQLNVFLGQRLQDYVESIHGAVPNAAIIAVGADQSLLGRRPKSRSQEPDAHGDVTGNLNSKPEPKSYLTIFYCGNFGNMHDSETLFDCFRKKLEVRSQKFGGLAWRFHCSGPKRAALEAERAALPEDLQQQIELGGGLDQAAWVAAMEDADVALVTMVPGSETVVMPSKTYSAMMAGQAILAIAPEDSDLVDLIKAAHCGWWVEPGDVEGLARVVEAMSADPALLLAKRECAYCYAHAHFGQDALAKAWGRALRADA